MPSTILECPHCGAETVGFRIVAEYLRPSTVQHLNYHIRLWDTLATCTKCEETVIVVYAHNVGVQPMHGSPLKCPSDPAAWDYSQYDVLPHPMPSRAPDHLPSPLPGIFLQAAKALKRGDWDASGAMSRKTIDVATKLLLGEDAKKHPNLANRIDALKANGGLTEDLRAWAHHVRLGGNDASHDEDPFKEPEAEELLDFIELFLTYVYTLPERVRQKRNPPA